ncbi:MAG: XRE family transcriptional regulator [Desulfobacterales bacterium]|jgi:predicted XRE-type DNA-binding protein|nr:XRE family transcriptional regulator [Desulfobacterales bacterium]
MKTPHEDIFKAIEDDPAVAENLRLRAQMMAMLRDTIKSRGLTQTAAAELLNVAQPRISDLTRGKIERFTIDALVNMLARAGIFLEVKRRRAA